MQYFLYEHGWHSDLHDRGLLYFGKMYDKYITENHLNIYGKTLIKLPTSRYTVLYNGMDEQPAFMQLRLSDFFIHPDFSGGERRVYHRV